MKKTKMFKNESLNLKIISKKTSFSKSQLKEIKGGSIVEDAEGF